MYRIAVLVHAYDNLAIVEETGVHRYLLFYVVEELKARGHSVSVVQGIPNRRVRADAAIMHVNATVIPPEYIRLAETFPFCVNIKTDDISKRVISGALLQKGQAWDGPVIVKSNLNYSGIPERRYNLRALNDRRELPFPGAHTMEEYRIYETVRDVPENLFDYRDIVVEKFVAEKEPDGYAIRFWVFCGNRERCNRYVSPDRLVKGPNVVRREPVPVPDDLRARRRDLGFEYGKFDFVVYDGRAVLLDANRTPSPPPSLTERGADYLADGLEDLIGEGLSRA